jgi:hypothetical protein
MIDASISEDYKNITRISILDSRKVFYPLSHVLQKCDITFDDAEALLINPMTEDVQYPSSVKLVDSGTIRSYKLEMSINNQLPEVQRKLERFNNKKVIVVFHHYYGKIIFGCNDQPLLFSVKDDNTVNPAANSGFSIECTGNAYYLKVLV